MDWMANYIGCHTCSQRRIDCDRTEPQCLKCEARGYKCPGFGIRYRFMQSDSPVKFGDHQHSHSPSQDLLSSQETKRFERFKSQVVHRRSPEAVHNYVESHPQIHAEEEKEDALEVISGRFVDMILPKPQIIGNPYRLDNESRIFLEYCKPLQ